MDPNEFQKLDTLLDWHLGQLDDETRSQMEGELKTNPSLRKKSDRLGQVLQPLDHWSLAPGSPNLTDKILARVDAERRNLTLEQPSVEDAGGVRRFPFGLSRNFIAAAACIALLVSLAIPSVSRFRANANRALCGNNLATVFRGVSTYQASFGGSIPYAGSVSNASWLPGAASKRPFASNSRHLYLLVKGNLGPQPKHFVCPGCSSSKPMEHRDGKPRNDFRQACNVSYASMNLAGSSPNLRPAPDVAYLSDGNPLFVRGRFDPSVDADRTNSRAHRGEGQMVLFLDGSAKWTTSPVNGIDRDNFWLAGNIRNYTGVETPVGKHDAHLVPGYPSTDPIVRQEY